MSDRTITTTDSPSLRTKTPNKGWDSATSQELSDDLLSVPNQFPLYDKTKKLSVLFSMLHIRKGELAAKQHDMNKILDWACKDNDEWVRMIGHILEGFTTTQKFNTSVEDWCESFKPLLDQIGQTVKSNGIHFHPKEFMFLQPNAKPSCPYESEVYKSGKPTLRKHFTLSTTPGDYASAQQRLKRFKVLLEQESRLASRPGNDAMDVDSQIHITTRHNVPLVAPNANRPRPPLPRNTPSANSMFIPRPPMRRPTVNKPSFLRPSGTVRFGHAGAMRSPGVRPPSATVDPTTPKGFIKHSRVQMLDFDDATMLQESNAREIDKAHQEIQKQDEQRRIERKKEREQKRRRKTSITSVEDSKEDGSIPELSPVSPGATTPTSPTAPNAQLPHPDSPMVIQPMSSDPHVA